MHKRRREFTFIVRIWQEPSALSPPGEWRGALCSLDGRQERLFKSAQELWSLLIQSDSPPQTDMGKTSMLTASDEVNDAG